VLCYTSMTSELLLSVTDKEMILCFQMINRILIRLIIIF
jgi:hypothetical protein